MTAKKHDVQGEGAKPRDHEHPRHHFWRHAHQDWRVWVAVLLMLALIGVFVMTNGLSVTPRKPAVVPSPNTQVP